MSTISLDPVQSLWIGDELSILEFLCIESFLHNGHSFHLYVYSQNIKVPSRITLKDANEIIPQNQIFLDKSGTFNNFSKKFCLALLLKKGGWWVNMNTVCLNPLTSDEEHAFYLETEPDNKHYTFCNSIVKMKKGSEVLKEAINNFPCHTFFDEYSSVPLVHMVFFNNLQQFIKQPASILSLTGKYLKSFFENRDLMLDPNFNLLLLSKKQILPYIDKDSTCGMLIKKYHVNESNQTEYNGLNASLIHLPDVTFIIPVRVDSMERLEALLILLDFLNKHFTTNVFILEIGLLSKIKLNKYDNINLTYQFEQDSDGIFIESKCLNKVIKSIQSSIIGIWMPELIIDPLQIYKTICQIRDYNVQVSFPYNGRFYLVDDILSYRFKSLLDICFLKENITNMNVLFELSKYGGPYFVSKNSFMQHGLINENFSDRNREGFERVRRIALLGGNISYFPGDSFCLLKPKTKYNWQNDPSLENKNIKELLLISGKSKEGLKEYITNWKDYG